MRYSLFVSATLIGSAIAAGLPNPFRRNSADSIQAVSEHTRILANHAERLNNLEMTISQIQVQLTANDRRPSLQRRPEVRRSSRSDTSVPTVHSLRRLPSDYSGGGISLSERHLSPPKE